MKGKTIERVLGIIAAIITILTCVGGIINRCSQHTNTVQSSDTEIKGVVSDMNGESDIHAPITRELEKEAFAQKWKDRKVHLKESERKGLFGFFWFMFSYFPGLNTLFIGVIFIWTIILLYNDDRLFKMYHLKYFLALLGLFLPLFWICIYRLFPG